MTDPFIDPAHEFNPTVPATDLGMTERNGHDEPALHLRRIQRRFEHEFEAKYLAGQAEHGGCLSQKPVMGQIKEEALDLIAYVYTAEEQLHRAIELLSKGIRHQDWGEATKALAILVTGNERGQV